MIADLPHAVYRLYGPADLILYIGCTMNPRKRLAGHKCKNKGTWWPYVERHEIDWYPNLREARHVETRELRRHRPLCNPVIPAEDGKHTTIEPGLVPVRSAWDRGEELAKAVGITMTAYVEEALRRENARRERTR